MSGIRLVLSVDAIKQPLTGIGRYTWELAKRLSLHPDIQEARFFSRGRWVGDVAALLSTWPATEASRRLISCSRIARAAYRVLSPYIIDHQLRDLDEFVYHSPNYLLPSFPGKSIATFHDLSIYRYPQFHPPERVNFMRREIPVALKRADHLITDSEYTRREIIEYFQWPHDKVTVVPLGVGEEYRPRSLIETAEVLAKYELSHGEYALCVSTIEPRKNIDGLLSAYKKLPESLRRRFPLVLAGDRGWKSDEIHVRIERAQREGWLRYLGYVAEGDLPFLFSGAYGFVFPPLYEGFGLPVLEAMASGVPVVCSNNSSLPEVAGGAALLVEPGDVEALAESLRVLLENETWRKMAAARSLESAGRFSWDKMAHDMVSVYGKL